MKQIFTSLTIFLIIFSCQEKAEIVTAQKYKSLISYINPFIVTGGHGHTYSETTMLFGMIQFSLDTRLDGWGSYSGLHFCNEYIYDLVIETRKKISIT